jgi:hypothetical protein
MDDWLHGHMAAVLLGIEILWVGGVVAVFLLYFVMKRRFARAKPPAETVELTKDPAATENAPQPPNQNKKTK